MPRAPIAQEPSYAAAHAEKKRGKGQISSSCCAKSETPVEQRRDIQELPGAQFWASNASYSKAIHVAASSQSVQERAFYQIGKSKPFSVRHSPGHFDATANAVKNSVALLARIAEAGHRYDGRCEVIFA